MFLFHTCAEDDVRTVYEKLPLTHMFGDVHSVLETGVCLRGRDEHDSLVARQLRTSARCRCVVFNATIDFIGGYGPVTRKKTQECPCIVALSSVIDWADVHTEPDLWTEHKDLRIAIGSMPFNPVEYMRTVLNDITMAIKAIQFVAKDRVWLKIAPLAMSPSIQTNEGVHVAQTAALWYIQAIHAALKQLSCSWVHTVEIVDFCGLFSHVQIAIPGVRVIVPSTRDILDFRGCPGNIMPAVIVPVDSFSAPWKRQEKHYDSLAVAVCNNTDIVRQTKDPTFVKVLL
jgi:hypothetical protein